MAKTYICLNCGEKIVDKKCNKRKFCSYYCMGKYNHKKSIEILKDDFINGRLGDYSARQYFRKTTEKKCSLCGITEWMGKPVPLVVDHIDGNHNNNFPSNFRFVCCNCDAFLPTFKAKNKGNGRVYRRL